MKILYNIHWLIVAYSAYISYEMYLDETSKIQSAQQSLQASKKVLMARKKKLEGIKSYEQEKETAKIEFNEVDAEFKASRDRLPSVLDHLSNKAFFDDVAKKLKIIGPLVTDKDPEKNHNSHFQKRYKLTGQGTFLQFLIFLERVSENDQLFNISSIHFKKIESKKKSRFQMLEGSVSITAYRYNENYTTSSKK